MPSAEQKHPRSQTQVRVSHTSAALGSVVGAVGGKGRVSSMLPGDDALWDLVL